MCVHYRRLKKDRPVPPSPAPSTKHEYEKEVDPAKLEAEDNDLFVGAAMYKDEKEAGPVTQKVEDNGFIFGAAMHKDEKEADPAIQKVHVNDFVVGADSGNTNIITIVVHKLAEDGTDGNLRQKDMRLLRLSRARYYRESGITNARKKTEKWNAGMKDHLEALSEVRAEEPTLKLFVNSWTFAWRIGMGCGGGIPSPGGLVCV